jgi:5-methyltetrahydrofolate--homocysteine methyltransferase
MAYDVSFDGSEVRTMMGIAPTDAARFMGAEGIDVVALNCGTGIDVERAAGVIADYHEVCDLPTMAQPNAGQPVLENMVVRYKQSADEMAAELQTLLTVRPGIVGGCCGSTPDHIRKIRPLIDQYNASNNQETNS